MLKPTFKRPAGACDPVDEHSRTVSAVAKHITIIVAHEAGDFVEPCRVLLARCPSHNRLFCRGPFVCGFSSEDFNAEEVVKLHPEWSPSKVFAFCAAVREVAATGHCLFPSDEDCDQVRVRELREAFRGHR